MFKKVSSVFQENFIKSFKDVSRIFQVLQFCCSMNLIAASRAKVGLVLVEKENTRKMQIIGSHGSPFFGRTLPLMCQFRGTPKKF